MNVGILGSGEVAVALAGGFLEYGHGVMLGTRSPEKLREWAVRNPTGRVGSFAEAASFADVAVLAVKGAVAAEVLRAAGPESLAGKVVIDTTNPIADSPPEDGVLSFFTSADASLLELLQREFVSLRLVKAFNSVGRSLMVNPRFKEGKPTMFICGNDAAAKATVSGVLDEFGWEVADMGGTAAARVIEPLCILWCIPGFLRNEWSHAFKLLR